MSIGPGCLGIQISAATARTRAVATALRARALTPEDARGSSCRLGGDLTPTRPAACQVISRLIVSTPLAPGRRLPAPIARRSVRASRYETHIGACRHQPD